MVGHLGSAPSVSRSQAGWIAIFLVPDEWRPGRVLPPLSPARQAGESAVPLPSRELVGDGGNAPLVVFRPFLMTSVLQTVGRIIARVYWWRQWELHPPQTDCETVSPLRHMCPRELARWVGAAPTSLSFGDSTAQAGAHRVRNWPAKPKPAGEGWCARRESHPRLRIGNAAFCY